MYARFAVDHARWRVQSAGLPTPQKRSEQGLWQVFGYRAVDGMDSMDGYACLCDKLSNMSLSKMAGVNKLENDVLHNS